MIQVTRVSKFLEHRDSTQKVSHDQVPRTSVETQTEGKKKVSIAVIEESARESSHSHTDSSDDDEPGQTKQVCKDWYKQFSEKPRLRKRSSAGRHQGLKLHGAKQNLNSRTSMKDVVEQLNISLDAQKELLTFNT